MKLILSLLLLMALQYAIAQNQKWTVSSIEIEGNNKTKAAYIERELLFKIGDTITAQKWEKLRQKSVENLINSNVFHDATIRISDSGGIKVTVVEKWYLWPILRMEIDERNFNTWWETKNLDRLSLGLDLSHNNMRGRGEIITLSLMYGYNRELGLSYNFPYINKSKTLGLAFSSLYTLRHEVNNTTEYDKQMYFKVKDEPAQEQLSSNIQLQYRPQHYLSFLLQLGFEQFRLNDSLVATYPNYGLINTPNFDYFELYFKAKWDHRDYKPYPLEGYYIDVELTQSGIAEKEENIDIHSIKSTSRYYLNIFHRTYLAFGLIAKYSGGMYQPYLLQKGLGYGRDYVRGYEYNVIDGQSYYVFKTNLKYALLPMRKFRLPYIETKKFNPIPIGIYANIFSDMGYVSTRQNYSSTNRLPNKWLSSVGLGIDLASYYQLVMRLEYTLNYEGESNFYLHFIAPI